MSVVRVLVTLWAGAAVLFAFIVGGILLLDSVPCLRRWTEPWDPELVALAALEDLYEKPAYERDGAA